MAVHGGTLLRRQPVPWLKFLLELCGYTALYFQAQKLEILRVILRLCVSAHQ